MKMEDFGACLRAQRKAKDLTIEQLAERLGLSATFLGEVERSDKTPSLQTIQKIITVLDISADSLFPHGESTTLDVRPFKEKLDSLSPAQHRVVEDLVDSLLRNIDPKN